MGNLGFFYRKYWNIIGDLTTAFALSCLNSVYLLKELNKTLIALIPKMDNPNRVSHYRPISLCNVAYKIISKTIVNKLQRLMDELVAPHQNAFTKESFITDNIILSSEVLGTIAKKKKG